MILVKTRREGNSCVLTLPRDSARELGIAPGDYVCLTHDQQGRVYLAPLEDYLIERAKARQHRVRPDRPTELHQPAND